MATSLTRTLARKLNSPRRFLTSLRHQSSQSGNNNNPILITGEQQVDFETLTVQRIEDAIHGIIVKRSAPDWLPFMPGSSYWVPPRRESYGIAELVHTFSNNLTDDEVMSLTTTRGWPSGSFFATQSGDEAVIQLEEGKVLSEESQSEDVEESQYEDVKESQTEDVE